ncbi:hypothetical protein AXK12_05025 [Cephaloticoccus capnophilus]|uniref:Uncharacterized protein n=2 Tax=Cephaloticoccus capnophilus TaxID=1548208 RepID=A0A139SM18_9BACT|nr:hypothetical protein AXK12_05025 [Cephaloticoccus capnophilus]
MLGFVIGAVFVLSLRRDPEVVYVREEVALPSPSPAAAAPPQEPDFTVLEAVFAEWQSYAVWDADVTEVALWDSDLGRYARFYEVLRAPSREGVAGGALTFYYRSIPALTRPVVTRGVSESLPLLFTEPDVLREAWLRQRDEETWSAIQESIRKLSAPRENE